MEQVTDPQTVMHHVRNVVRAFEALLLLEEQRPAVEERMATATQAAADLETATAQRRAEYGEELARLEARLVVLRSDVAGAEAVKAEHVNLLAENETLKEASAKLTAELANLTAKVGDIKRTLAGIRA